MRMFVAVVPTEPVVEDLDAFLAARRDAAPFRWTLPEHLHVTLAFLAGRRLTTVALQGVNLTNHRPVLAREQLVSQGPGSAAARATFGNPVAWAEPLSLKLVLGLEL